MRPKVNLADVVVAQHSGVSCIGGVVSSTVVDGAAGGESQACLQPVFFDEPPGAVLQPLTARSRKQHAEEQQRDYCQARQCIRESCSPGCISKLFFFFMCVSVETTSCSQISQYVAACLTRCRSWSSPVWSSSWRTSGPADEPQQPAWNRSTSPRWPGPARASPHWWSAMLHCAWRERTHYFLIIQIVYV